MAAAIGLRRRLFYIYVYVNRVNTVVVKISRVKEGKAIIKGARRFQAKWSSMSMPTVPTRSTTPKYAMGIK